MNDIIVSLSENLLKVTYFGSAGFGGISSEVSAELVQNSDITDVSLFSEVLEDLISQVLPSKSKNYTLNFLVEPQDAILEFATVSKKGGEVDSQIINCISAKLGNAFVPEDYYFSYQKIAPFIYQFVAIKREQIDKYIEISNLLKVELKSVIPWVLLLPKLVNNNQPSIFVSSNHNKQVVALSELNGIYFTGVYEKEKTQAELQSLVQKLSVYNRSVPINKIYTVNCNSFTLDPNYEVLPLAVPNEDLEDSKGYEIHLLLNNVLDSQADILGTQINLLNLLPVPVVEKKKVPVVQVGAVLLAMLLVLGFGYLIVSRRNAEVKPPETLVDNSDESSVVLSETTDTNEATESNEEDEEVGEQVPLERVDLKIRVENGAGIAGIASTTRDFLVALDYDVVSIGDALEFGRENTLLNFKKDAIQYKDLLVEDMKDSYDVVVEEELDAAAEYDVLIIVGLN